MSTFDPSTLDHAALVETNRRLNTRCQRLEHLVAKYRRRYVSVMRPAKEALEKAMWHAKQVKELADREWREYYSDCPWCRLRLRFRQWVRKW